MSPRLIACLLATLSRQSVSSLIGRSRDHCFPKQAFVPLFLLRTCGLFSQKAHTGQGHVSQYGKRKRQKRCMTSQAKTEESGRSSARAAHEQRTRSSAKGPVQRTGQDEKKPRDEQLWQREREVQERQEWRCLFCHCCHCCYSWQLSELTQALAPISMTPGTSKPVLGPVLSYRLSSVVAVREFL